MVCCFFLQWCVRLPLIVCFLIKFKTEECLNLIRRASCRWWRIQRSSIPPEARIIRVARSHTLGTTRLLLAIISKSSNVRQWFWNRGCATLGVQAKVVIVQGDSWTKLKTSKECIIYNYPRWGWFQKYVIRGEIYINKTCPLCNIWKHFKHVEHFHVFSIALKFK